MGKATFLLGAGLGFILGSRAGRGPYQQIESKVREITRRPQVQDRLHQLQDAAQDQAAAVADKAAPSQSPPEHGGVAVPEPSQESYVDPQDLQFSTAAARKEEMVDELLGARSLALGARGQRRRATAIRGHHRTPCR